MLLALHDGGDFGNVWRLWNLHDGLGRDGRRAQRHFWLVEAVEATTEHWRRHRLQPLREVPAIVGLEVVEVGADQQTQNHHHELHVVPIARAFYDSQNYSFFLAKIKVLTPLFLLKN